MRKPNLALVGVHGPPEITGLALGAVEGWDIEIANQAAVDAGVRYVKRNLAVGFGVTPPIDRTAANYELWRPEEIKELAIDREVVIEVHDRPDAEGEYVTAGGLYLTRLLGVAALLGIRSVIGQGGIPTLGNYAANTIGVEFCRNDTGNSQRRLAKNVERLSGCMKAISRGELPTPDACEFEYYDYVTEISQEQALILGLNQLGITLEPFQPIPQDILNLLELPSGESYVAEYWNGISSGGWFGGVLRRAPVPLDLSERPTIRARGADIKFEPEK